MTAVQDAMFAECPLPACHEITDDPRTPCPACREAFGGRLRPSGQETSAEEAAAAYAERDAYVAAVLEARRDGWLSPVCVITPRKYRNHTACDFTLCTCGCHKQQERAA